MHLWQKSNVGSCGILQRSDESSQKCWTIPTKRNKGSCFRKCVIISTRLRKNSAWKKESSRMHWKRSRTSFAWWLCSSEKIVSGWRGDGQKKLGKAKSDIALHETNNLNHRDWSYIKQASGLTELKKKHRLFGDFSTKYRIYQELHTRDCQEVDEFAVSKRIKSDIWELMNSPCSRKGIAPPWINFCPKFRNCSKKWTFWLKKKIYMILRQQEALECPTFPVNPGNSESQKNDQLRFGFAAQYSEWCG